MKYELIRMRRGYILNELGPMQLAMSLSSNLHGEIDSLKVGLNVFRTDNMIEFTRD